MAIPSPVAGAGDGGARTVSPSRPAAVAGGERMPAPDADPAAAPPERQAALAAAQEIARTLAPSAADVEFSVDEASGRVLLRVVDRKTGELIRQLPSEEILSVWRALERLSGLLLDDRA